MRTGRLYIALASLVLVLGIGPAGATAAPAHSPRVALAAFHFGHSGLGRGGGLFGRSSSRRGFGALSGRRTGRSSGLLRRIGHALVIGYLLHLLFAGSGGGGFILLLIIVALFFAHRRRRRAREYYGGQRGAWR